MQSYAYNVKELRGLTNPLDVLALIRNVPSHPLKQSLYPLNITYKKIILHHPHPVDILGNINWLYM